MIRLLAKTATALTPHAYFPLLPPQAAAAMVKRGPSPAHATTAPVAALETVHLVTITNPPSPSILLAAQYYFPLPKKGDRPYGDL